MSTKRVPLPWTTVITASTTAEFVPATPWMEAADAIYGRAAWEMHNISSSNMEVAPAWQIANTEDDPGGSADLDNIQTATGVYYPPSTAAGSIAKGWQDMLGNSAAGTQDKMLVRFGWRVKIGSGTTPEYASVAGVVEYQGR